VCCGHSPLLSSHVPSTWLHVSWLRVCVGASSGDREPWAISGLFPLHTCSLGSPAGALHSVTLSPLSCSPTWQWFRDGAPLPDGRSSYAVSNKERTLTLQSASPDDNGLYYCCARSAVGFVCSQNNFTLNIIGELCPGCPGLGARLKQPPLCCRAGARLRGKCQSGVTCSVRSLWPETGLNHLAGFEACPVYRC